MVRKSTEIVEDLINALEKMIDAQDDMWQEEKYANYREQIKIHDERLIPAKEEFKTHLDEYIDRRIETYCVKHHITRMTFSNQVDKLDDI